ncbi:lipoprotein [Pediococcus claussenii]|uniref:Lipoprotein n=1 Tax=Pediococcus claussenii (strain ATCC BAA-344 / DSM 14800 / JCM 18046 / KCTC 3811 / LMG 21948 / P06) TaxID=701521 RepID=G8PBB8_PEDCP|nr:lipoprotein [Pediococcus claussenii]AEV95907.1 putative lipoprotein [Pediococcus claussenii ATCC BAA-344]KRN20512.1 hypothetical protein IV79_GL000569 [Pediococcus claussenii]
MKIKSAVITMVLLAGIVLAGCRKQVTTSSNSSTSKTESSKENSSSSKKKETKIEKLSTSQIFNKYFANKTLVSKISETSIIDIEHTTDQGYTFVGKHRANGTWVDDENKLDNCTFTIRDKTVIITGNKVGAKAESPVKLLINFDGTITNVKTQNDYLVLDRTVANYEGNPNIGSNDIDTQLTQDTVGKSNTTTSTNNGAQTKQHYSSKSTTTTIAPKESAKSDEKSANTQSELTENSTEHNSNAQSSNTNESGTAHESTQPSKPQVSNDNSHNNGGATGGNSTSTNEKQNK